MLRQFTTGGKRNSSDQADIWTIKECSTNLLVVIRLKIYAKNTFFKTFLEYLEFMFILIR